MVSVVQCFFQTARTILIRPISCIWIQTFFSISIKSKPQCSVLETRVDLSSSKPRVIISSSKPLVILFLVTHDLDNKRAWAPCLRVEGVKLPTGYFIGASAATGKTYFEFFFCLLIFFTTSPG